MKLATEEDKLYHIDQWAALFKATTWEELKMYAQKDEYIQEASNTIYQLSQDEIVRQQCEAREDYYRRQRSVQHYIEDQARELERKDSRIADLDMALKERNSIIAKREADLKAKDSLIAEKESNLRAKDSLIAELQAELEKLKRTPSAN